MMIEFTNLMVGDWKEMTTLKITFTSQDQAYFFEQNLKKIQEKQTSISYMRIKRSETDTLFWIDSEKNFISGFNNGYLSICFLEKDIFNSILVNIRYVDNFENYPKYYEV